MRAAAPLPPPLLNSMAEGSQPLTGQQQLSGSALTQTTPQQKVQGWLNTQPPPMSTLPGQASSPQQFGDATGTNMGGTAKPNLSNAALKLLNKTAKERIATFNDAIMETTTLAGKTLEATESLVCSTGHSVSLPRLYLRLLGPAADTA